MGTDYETKIRYKGRKTLKDIEKAARSRGFVTELKTDYLTVESTDIRIYDNIGEGEWNLSITYGSLFQRDTSKLRVNIELLRSWNEVVAFMLREVGETLAVTSEDSIQYSDNFKFFLRKILGVYYKSESEIIPVLRESIKEFSGKSLKDDEIIDIMEESTSFKETIDGITCRSFLQVGDGESNYGESKLRDLVEKRYGKIEEKKIRLEHKKVRKDVKKINYLKALSKLAGLTGINEKYLEEKIAAKMKKLDGLLSREGALQLVANELGIKLEDEDVFDKFSRKENEK